MGEEDSEDDVAAPRSPGPLRADLVAEVQQTRAENYFASVNLFHRLLADHAPSGALSAQQAVELADALGFPLEVEPEEAMDAGADGTVDAWEFETWWKHQWMRASTCVARATRAFEGSEVNHLSVAAGDECGVLNNSDREWWLCSLGDSEGWVPARLLMRIDGFLDAGGSGSDSVEGEGDVPAAMAVAAAMADPARPRASQPFALGGKSAVWQHLSFVDALADPIAARGRRSGLEPLLRTMRLIGCCLAPKADEGQPSLAGTWAPDVQRSWHDATALTESLSQCKPDMKELHVVIESWMNRVLSLRKDGSPAIFPVGWRRKHAGQETETAMLGVLSKVGRARYSLAVCSSGTNEGAAEYLATIPDKIHGGELLRSRRCVCSRFAHVFLTFCSRFAHVRSLVIESIPAVRIEDSTLWFLLFRPAVFASASNGPQLLFERVLPYLGERPLLRNTHGTSVPIPRGGDPSQWGGAIEAIKCALTTQGSEAAASCEVLLHGRLLQLACLDVRAAGQISAGDGALLRLSSRTVAALAAIEARRDGSAMELEVLAAVNACLEQLEQCISAAEPDEVRTLYAFRSVLSFPTAWEGPHLKHELPPSLGTTAAHAPARRSECAKCSRRLGWFR